MERSQITAPPTSTRAGRHLKREGTEEADHTYKGPSGEEHNYSGTSGKRIFVNSGVTKYGTKGQYQHSHPHSIEVDDKGNWEHYAYHPHQAVSSGVFSPESAGSAYKEQKYGVGTSKGSTPESLHDHLTEFHERFESH